MRELMMTGGIEGYAYGMRHRFMALIAQLYRLKISLPHLTAHIPCIYYHYYFFRGKFFSRWNMDGRRMDDVFVAGLVPCHTGLGPRMCSSRVSRTTCWSNTRFYIHRYYINQLKEKVKKKCFISNNTLISVSCLHKTVVCRPSLPLGWEQNSWQCSWWMGWRTIGLQEFIFYYSFLVIRTWFFFFQDFYMKRFVGVFFFPLLAYQSFIMAICY